MRKIASLSLLSLSACISDPVLPDGGSDAQMPPNDSSTGMDSGAMDQMVAMSDVNGTVVDEYGNPVSGAAVRIGMLTATTDVQGKFTLKAAPVYRIEIVHFTETTTTAKRILVIEGLTTRTPNIQAIAAHNRTAQNLTLTATGLGGTVPNGQKIYFWTEPNSKTNDGAGRIFLAGGSTMQSYAASWQGAPTIAGTMVGLVLTIPLQGKFPTSFQTYGTTAFSLNGGGSSSATVNVAAFNAGNSTASGSIAYSGGTGTSLAISYRSSGLAGPSFFDFAFTGTSFMLPMPGNPAWRGFVRSGADTPSGGFSYAWKAGIQPGAMGIALVHPPDLVPTAPPNAATMVDANTVFAWPARPNVSFVLDAFCGNGFAPDVQIDVITQSPMATFPDTTALGSGLPSGGACHWTTSTINAAKTDDAVGPAGWQRFINPAFSDTDGASVKSKDRTFTPK